MLSLVLRTDKPEAELGLYEDTKQLAYLTWQADRRLAETLHKTIEAMCRENKKQLQDIQGIVVFQGPGSFTGLRIGIATANALSYSLDVPIVGATGDDWAQAGAQKLLAGKNDTVVVPDYGAAPHITVQKK